MKIYAPDRENFSRRPREALAGTEILLNASKRPARACPAHAQAVLPVPSRTENTREGQTFSSQYAQWAIMAESTMKHIERS